MKSNVNGNKAKEAKEVKVTQKWNHDYYGAFDENEKPPRNGVQCLMVNEFITRHLNKEKEKFSREIKKMVDSFAASKSMCMKEMNNEYKELKELLNNIIKINNLKMLKSQEKKKKTKVISILD